MQRRTGEWTVGAQRCWVLRESLCLHFKDLLQGLGAGAAVGALSSRAPRGVESGITSLMRFAFHFSATVPNSISRRESGRDAASCPHLSARPGTFFHDIASHCLADLSQWQRINITATKDEQLWYHFWADSISNVERNDTSSIFRLSNESFCQFTKTFWSCNGSLWLVYEIFNVATLFYLFSLEPFYCPWQLLTWQNL